MLRSDMSSPHSKPMATRSGPLSSTHPKTSPTPRVTPQGARPAPARACLIAEVHPKNWPEFSKKHGVGAYHKPFNTLHSILVHPKDKTPDHKKCSVVYEIQLSECPAQYVGETAHTLETRMKDHLKQKSPREHEHPIKMDDVKVIAHEDNMWARKIRESIEIRTRHPAINHDQGYELPLIYDELLSGLIRLMKWPWWSRKLATLQHIWLW